MVHGRRVSLALLLCGLLCTLLVPFALVLRSPTVCSVSDEEDDYELGSAGGHRLAVIIPFRDRFDELLRLAPHLHRFLRKQRIRHRLVVVNQIDTLRFNRGSLINAGFLESEADCDYVAMHDVDLLPLNPQLSYAFPPNGGPHHLAAPGLHPRYHYPTFVGGILLLSTARFRQLNGISNRYWGWGLEDDEFYARIREAGLNVTRPVGITTGKKTRSVTCTTADAGLGTRHGQLTRDARHKLKIDGAPVDVLDVRLFCNRTDTPWCELPVT
ncbi:hypothetical protein MRX96_048792 [Rhipicephalus microplus]